MRIEQCGLSSIDRLTLRVMGLKIWNVMSETVFDNVPYLIPRALFEQ